MGDRGIDKAKSASSELSLSPVYTEPMARKVNVGCSPYRQATRARHGRRRVLVTEGDACSSGKAVFKVDGTIVKIDFIEPTGRFVTTDSSGLQIPT